MDGNYKDAKEQVKRLSSWNNSIIQPSYSVNFRILS
jgi:hypothetical protein